jgi:hypothetical protein
VAVRLRFCAYPRGVHETRRAYSVRRLAELTERLGPVLPHLEDEPLCVYATGSYGRLEAWEGSDIDLFFLYDDAEPHPQFAFTTFVRLAACLVDATEDMGFPPFSGDGKYLEVGYVRQMEQVLGSPQDDSINAFTARMLLLLESRPVHHAELYERLLERVISFYYRDFPDHDTDFIPLFLTNDILRFWRTLTLNYEHHRLKLLQLLDEELERKKADSALKNYKLKVSRLLTCFSMVANLATEPAPVRLETVLELCQATPRERLGRLAQQSEEAAALVTRLDGLYEDFLASVQHNEAELLDAFRDDGRRKEALRDASEFGMLLYELLRATTTDERMRYLVI